MLALMMSPYLAGQTDWPVYGHDSGGMRYSPIAQIDVTNVGRLRRAWTWHTGEKGSQFQSTPIVVGNRMYLSTQLNRIVALEPETGKEIWSYDPKVRRAREHRGVAYWPGDANAPARIVFATVDGRLIALDAATGAGIPSFGTNGEVDLRAGVADKFPGAAYGMTSPPAIYRDLAVVGPSTQETSSRGPSGDPRAFDIRTGKLVWRFHTVPQPGEPGNDTWGPDGWKDRAGPSLWGSISVDPVRGLVFLSTGNPADSWWGGDRKGTNLYANSVLALDAPTGHLRWHHQLVHHDIFDYDLPGGPTLIEAMKNGRRIPAVAQITKMGLLFIFDRVTGEPVFGVEERPVPRSEIPGEEAWPTQPFPLKPPPLVRTTIRRDELSTRTPEAARYCRELFDQLRVGDLYTPFGSQKTLVFPGAMGGGNWGGVSFDPRLGYIFVNTSNMAAIGQIVPAAEGAAMPFRNATAYARFLDQERYPCQQPPWGELSAVNAATGAIVWKVPLGHFDELAPQGLQKTGTPNVGGTIATAGGLVFVGATNDSKLRAFNSRTGRELWAARLDATGNATPITYRGRDGQQYVVIAAGGPSHLRSVGDMSNNSADTLIAFSLNGREPEPAPRPAAPRTPAASQAPAPVVTLELPEGDAKPLVVRMCATRCHGVSAFAGHRLNRDQWKAVVDNMAARGMEGTPAEIQRVLDYLAENLASKREAATGALPTRPR
jgi:quinoprotein glucose dehydrogenase